MSAADPGISRKKRKCGKKFRKIENILGTQEVYVHCVYNCGRTYRTMQYPLDKKAWNVTLRKLNAHESQRCPKMTINTNSASPKRKKISHSQRAPKIEEVKHFHTLHVGTAVSSQQSVRQSGLDDHLNNQSHIYGGWGCGGVLW